MPRGRPTLLLFLVLASLPWTPVFGQVAHLVKDIEPDLPPFSSFPTNAGWMVDLGGVVYFAADDGLHGQELWRTDGTTAGTFLVKDICPGICGSLSVSEIRASGGRLFFAADDGAHGRELWSSDGTASGTTLVVNLEPGLASSYPASLTDVQGILYFKASDPLQQQPAGEQVFRVEPATLAVTRATALVATQIDHLLALGSGVFFDADDHIHGYEPWVTDGTPAGTEMLGDLRAGSDSSIGPVGSWRQDWDLFAASLGDRVVFQAAAGSVNSLWVTDGTPEGTKLISNYAPNYFLRSGSRVFFECEGMGVPYGLCATDGSAAGTTLLHDFGSDAFGIPAPFAAASGVVYFNLYISPVNVQVWRSDGSALGTQLLKDLGAGQVGSEFGFFGAAELDGKLLFFANDGSTGLEPWVTDGSESGTSLLTDLNPGPMGSTTNVMGSRFAAVGGRLVFFATTPTTGWQLFSTDGTALGTGLLRTINAETSSLFATLDLTPGFFGLSRYPVLAGDGHGKALLVPWRNEFGAEPWYSDGTEPGTHLVQDIKPGQPSGASRESPAFADRGGSFVFVPAELSTPMIGLSDGTTSGTQAIALTGSTMGPWNLTPCLGRVFFDAGGLWQSDGTALGTSLVDAESAWDLSCAGDHLVALAVGPATRLVTFDGAGPAVHEVHSWSGATPISTAMALNESAVFFGLDDGVHGPELWTSDGTDKGTHLALDVNPGPAGAISNSFQMAIPGLPRQASIVATRTRAFFIADDGSHGQELWTSDGSAAGTFMLRDINPGAMGSEPRQLVAARDRVFFVADDGGHGREVWTSDGSTAGTVLVDDLMPGAGSSNPWDLRVIDDALVFGATDGISGMELWRSRGSAASTRLLQDIAPGSESSTPMGFTRSGDRVYFYADDGVHGFEPWTFPVGALGDDFFIVPPCRAFDSRSSAALTDAVPVSLTLAGHCGIPPTARAVVLTVTAVASTSSGEIAIFRPGDPAPAGGVIAVNTGQARAGNAILAVSPDGLVVLPRLQPGCHVDLIVDVSGYFE